MHIDFLLSVFNENLENHAILVDNQLVRYDQLLNKISKMNDFLISKKISSGTVVGLSGDFSLNTISLMLSLIENACIIVPLNSNNLVNEKNLIEIAKVEILFKVNPDESIESEIFAAKSDIPLYQKLRDSDSPGLVLFTSGTSGQPKAAVHNYQFLLEKFKKRKTALRTLNFLLFDHWGGLNTMFHILSNGGLLISVKDRKPESIAALIEKHKIELLPTSPTFLNLLLLSEAHKKYDMSSLQIISYGTEPMPKSTIKRLKNEFPNVKLLQTYGLIELGVLRSQSESNSSLWMKVGGEGYKTRVVDGILQIKAKSAMLGYLNAPSPFTEDGWFITGDEVLQKGDFIKVLGRKSEIINVGGEKVYPQEVESVILEIESVAEVIVFGERNPIIGNIVCAKVRSTSKRREKDLIKEIQQYCRTKLAPFKIPIKIELTDNHQYNMRFKKIR